MLFIVVTFFFFFTVNVTNLTDIFTLRTMHHILLTIKMIHGGTKKVEVTGLTGLRLQSQSEKRQ